MPEAYPVVLRLEGIRVILVGAGNVATRKLRGLLDAGADVTVVAPMISAEAAGSGAHLEQRPYRRGEAADYQLVMTATDDPAVNAQVADDARAAGVFVNSADDPDNCTFTLPAIARRGPLNVAVSTGGASPALSGWLRDLLASHLPSGIERAIADLEAQRREMQGNGVSTESIDWRDRIVEAVRRAADS